MSSSTFAVRLTAPGRGAIASVLLAGPSALTTVDALFRSIRGRAVSTVPTGRIIFGRWEMGNGEEVVICRRSEQDVEIHCHGGHAAITRILATLTERGCTELDWQTWLKQQIRDPIVADARIAVAKALTQRTAAILLDQMRGTLGHALASVIEALRDNRCREAQATLEVLRHRIPLGRRLTAPWRVVLAGPPNAGKSSLANAILGFQRSIVFEQPGTTRDVVSGQTAVDGWPVELLDTAGLRYAQNRIEVEGIRRARTEIARADLVVFVIDATAPVPPETFDSPSIVVYNKCDLLTASRDSDKRYVSAVTQEGLEELLTIVASTLVPAPPPAAAPVPFTEQQAAAITEAIAAIQRADVPQALSVLQSYVP